ncbi:class I SAM-dependent methyltransferase [Undibacterium sp. TJN25]|uniref:class I SAM-dependent methyltransferase n=1 Tax=Undibacterium sp. TJN25 TaxID=3413056 RepID=UPI003BF3805A
MSTAATYSAAKFTARAAEYEEQSRIALAGYDACHELAACMLAASLGSGGAARILVAGAGGPAREITLAGRLEPGWRFTAVDPSPVMLEIAMGKVAEAGMTPKVEAIAGTVADLPQQARFDAATLIGVLHHLPGDDAKRAILHEMARRLKPGAPLILACNRYAYASQPLLLAAWGERWRQQGASPDEVKAKLGKILQGADPPHSEQAVAVLLAEAGFDTPLPFFSSLFWGAWIAYRRE